MVQERAVVDDQVLVEEEKTIGSGPGGRGVLIR